MSQELKPCPFCGGEAEFERLGDRRQSCIVVCTDCGCRHESGDEGYRNGQSWNSRATPPIGTKYRNEAGKVAAVVMPTEAGDAYALHACLLQGYRIDWQKNDPLASAYNAMVAALPEPGGES